MGGRGATSFTPGGGKGSAEKFHKDALGTKVPATLNEALGSKGKSITVSSSYEKANPYFSREYDEYSANCQRCVVAYEMRRRGYDVMAMPTYAGDIKPRVAFKASDGTINGRWMGAFKNAKAVPMKARSANQAKDALNKHMQSYGSGSRGVVEVFWKNGGGHVFNVENIGGKIRYYDAQTGKTVNINEYMGHAKPGSVNLVRTDNLRVSNRMREFVTQR